MRFFILVSVLRNMSYLIKLHSTPVLLDSVLNNSIHCSTVYHSLSPNFHRPRLIFRQNFQKLSTNVNALPLKKKVVKNRQNILHQKRAIVLQNLTKILETTKLSKTTTKRKTTLLKSSPALSKNIENNFDSTKSYDPNLLDYNLEIEKFFKDCGSYKHLQSSRSACSPKDELPRNKLKEKTKPTVKLENKPDNKPQNLKKNSSIRNTDNYRFLKILKTNQLQLAEKPLEKPKPKPVIQDDVDHRPRERSTPLGPKKSALVSDKDASFQESLSFDNFILNKSAFHQKIETLHSVLDIYITKNQVCDGFKQMKHYRKGMRWKETVEVEQENLGHVFNTLLDGLSEKGHWDLMQEVIKWMSEDNIRLNSQSFAALFYCLAEVKECCNENVEQRVDNVINWLFANNISLNDIFTKTILSKDKTEKILALIQDAVPSFDIQPIKINLSSDCCLTKSLHMNNNNSNSNNLESPATNMGIETMKSLVEEQLLLEKKFIIQVEAVSKGYTGGNVKAYEKIVSDLKEDWRITLKEAIDNTLKIHNLSNLKRPSLYVYLNSLPSQEIADYMTETAVELVEFSGGYSPSTTECGNLLGSKVAHRFYLSKKLLKSNVDRTEQLFNQYVSWYLNPCGPARNSRQKWQMLIQESDKTCQLDVATIKWPDYMKRNLGKFLLDTMIKELKFPLERDGVKKYFSVFCTVLRFRDGVWREEVRCNPYISRIFQKNGLGILNFRADYLPMVCPPKPWKSANHGGYLIHQCDLIRKTFGAGKILKLEDVPAQNMYPTLDALNALQGVPWKVNEEVLDLILDVFRKGGSEKLRVPCFPDGQEFLKNAEDIRDGTFQEQVNLQYEKKLQLKKKNEAYALWCEALYRLSLANHFRKRMFWLPQNCDFRGRVYPVPPLINHLGSDMYRSLLVFAKGKPLGPGGLDWLKIHLINLTGTHKRVSVLDRLAYANEILPLILDSAEKPFTGHKWWMESEEPWQTLAACMEIKKVLSSPDPENYICHFPVHQDGSCNGLQHYAGLGKDVIGAQSVNLSAQNLPQDVYSLAATLIEEERAKDEEKGMELAKVLRGVVQRKVIKQTVMTTVYGVTPFGARAQIAKRLEELPDFPEKYVKAGAAYLTYKTFLCLNKMFTSAREIQDWFVKCAESITASNEFVQWMSPLGFPVLQSYGKLQIDPVTKIPSVLPDRRKQKNAFPPNFIHSLDSSHMMLTALFCEQVGVTFAAVHDCFWTHPISVNLMNKICREQFISLHSQPILENLSQNFIRQYLENNTLNNEERAKIFEAIPEKGSFDIKEVLNSVYFFS